MRLQFWQRCGQIEASLAQIADVRVEATEAGLQVILETADGSLEVPEARSVQHVSDNATFQIGQGFTP